MSKVFTDEKFTGYEFRCETTSANTGFKHVCKVLKDNTEVEEAKAVVNWGNRTWEAYQYASVLEGAKSNLEAKLSGVKEPDVDYGFLNVLADRGYIRDYGNFENGTPIIIFDGWYQVEGEEEREYAEGKGMVKTGKFIKSVYARLVELAEKNLLKPSINETIKNVEYVFSDQYERCWECGTVHSLEYGDLTYLEDEGMLLCDECINSSDRVASLIEEAKEDMRKALNPTIHQDIIEGLGYTLVTDETFSFEREFWGATYMTEKFAEDFCNRYNGFAQIYEVAQFVVPFQLWVPNDRLEEAREEIASRFNLAVAQEIAELLYES